MLSALFAKIQGPGTPDKISENDYLMKGRCLTKLARSDRIDFQKL